MIKEDFMNLVKLANYVKIKEVVEHHMMLKVIKTLNPQMIDLAKETLFFFDINFCTEKCRDCKTNNIVLRGSDGYGTIASSCFYMFTVIDNRRIIYDEIPKEKDRIL